FERRKAEALVEARKEKDIAQAAEELEALVFKIPGKEHGIFQAELLDAGKKVGILTVVLNASRHDEHRRNGASLTRSTNEASHRFEHSFPVLALIDAAHVKNDAGI